MSSTARNIDYKILARLLQESNRYKEIGSVENQTSFILDKLLREKKNRPFFFHARSGIPTSSMAQKFWGASTARHFSAFVTNSLWTDFV